MKFYLSVDMEGVTVLVDETFVDSNKLNYSRGQEMMTQEANHVIEAAFGSGCSAVTVNDSHSKMNNLLIEKLHPEARLISGDVKPFSMVQGLDSTYEGMGMIGYHARAGMPGVMTHSMFHNVRNFYINDQVVGELGMNAYVAGYFGVPILFVAGDDRAALEAEELIPNITTAVVKETISRSSALLLSPQKTGQVLRQQTEKAMLNRHHVEPLVPPREPIFRIEFANHGHAEWASLMPGVEIEKETTVKYQAKNMLEVYQAMLVMTELASRTTFS
ncbi:M55 family metallopeptidase [Guptibacillus hwajinpoensis]|uniref:M55 family metallopeptidase n=1 Tax=Guptibacillus hwajinpoensis TaxID=208199 RepID=UPI00273F3219|nr:M55 family metallopeptidase [Pseudalkalibacillus hwajinpoensis]WLR59928.1 M55 family metallopeptidase [Pseudalkalibacillus hwajinpoensis]